MSLLAKSMFGFAAFLVVFSVPYGLLTRDYVGLALCLSLFTAAVFVGWYATGALRRSQVELVEGTARPGTAADDEAHVKPTIWPLVLTLALAGITVAMVTAWWVALPSAVMLVVAGAGWTLDVQRQWRDHHAHAHAGAVEEGGSHS